jgi:SNF2 family DNA or RNA helicase
VGQSTYQPYQYGEGDTPYGRKLVEDPFPDNGLSIIKPLLRKDPIGPLNAAAKTIQSIKNNDYDKTLIHGVVHGVGTVGKAMAFAPHPAIKGIGTVVSTGADIAEPLLDYHRYKNRPVAFRRSPENIKLRDDTEGLKIPTPLLAKSGSGRCWEGYKPVPLKEPYSEDSCKPVEAKKKEKKADDLMEHQRRIVEKLKNPDQEGLILMHGLGSGKTRSSIEAYKALGLPAEVIAPAALKENYRKEIKKWLGKHPKNLHIRSQQEVSRKGLGDDLTDKLMIVDEAHRMRNDTSKLYNALSEANPKKRILLSGTPIYNHPGDIATLVNIAAGDRLMPEDKKSFEERYISRKEIPVSFAHRIMGIKPGEEVSLKNKEELKKIFSKYVDYHAGNSEGFPSVKSETVGVPMAEQQKELYGTMMKDIPWLLRKKIELGLAPNKRELDKLIPFLTGARMISNTTGGFVKDPRDAVSPKINKAFKYLKDHVQKDKNYKALVYSNYLESGINPYKKLLNDSRIPYGEFTGEIKEAVRNKLVQDYNANKIRALLVSSAGGEGLDLKGTRLVQLLEPHFNNEKLKQVIGRAARYKSHEMLSPEERKVLVQHYLSTIKPTKMQELLGEKTTSTDEYLQNLADSKQKLNNEFLNIIKSGEANVPLKSSNVSMVGYDKKDKTLEVKFHNGGEYKYNKVPKALYRRLLKAKSPGKFLHKHIKKDNKYSYERIEKD